MEAEATSWGRGEGRQACLWKTRLQIKPQPWKEEEMSGSGNPKGGGRPEGLMGAGIVILAGHRGRLAVRGHSAFLCITTKLSHLSLHLCAQCPCPWLAWSPLCCLESNQPARPPSPWPLWVLLSPSKWIRPSSPFLGSYNKHPPGCWVAPDSILGISGLNAQEFDNHSLLLFIDLDQYCPKEITVQKKPKLRSNFKYFSSHI